MHSSTAERLEFIRRLILEQKTVSIRELLDRMNDARLKGVSKRNLIEDIKKLRIGKYQKPLNIIFKDGAYKIAGSPIWMFQDLNEEEQCRAELFLAFLEYKPHGFSGLLAKSLKNEFGMENSISKGIEFKNGFPFLSDTINRRVSAILNAFKENSLLEFYYGRVNDPRTNDKSKLVILLPLKIVFWNHRAYVFGIPHDQEPILENIKNYAIDSISSKIGLKMGPNNHSWSAIFDELNLNDYLKDCIGVWRPKDEQPQKVRRWLKGWAASYMKANPLHPSQMILDTRNHETEILFQWVVFVTPELTYEFSKFREFIKSF